MTPSENQRRSEEADAILDLVAAVEAVRASRDSDVRFLVGGRLDATFHDLLVSTVARAVTAADRPLPVELGGLSAHTWVEVRRRAREHAGQTVEVPGRSSHLPRHAAEIVPVPVDPVPVEARNVELVEAFGALLDADDAVYGQGHSARVLATARDMALRAVMPA
jgi:hypothetical protein